MVLSWTITLDGMISQTVSVIKIYLCSRVIQIPCLKWSSS